MSSSIKMLRKIVGVSRPMDGMYSVYSKNVGEQEALAASEEDFCV